MCSTYCGTPCGAESPLKVLLHALSAQTPQGPPSYLTAPHARAASRRVDSGGTRSPAHSATTPEQLLSTQAQRSTLEARTRTPGCSGRVLVAAPCRNGRVAASAQQSANADEETTNAAGTRATAPPGVSVLQRREDASVSLGVRLIDVLEQRGALLLVQLRLVGARKARIEHVLNREAKLRTCGRFLPPIEHE